MGKGNPVIRTAGVLEHWRRAQQQGVPRLAAADAVDDPSRIRPGMIFVLDSGGGAGHTGGRLITVEGNTNDDGSREGIGVFQRHGRKIAAINRGFIDYSGR
ncbi:MAG: hypothetical protein ACHQ7H_01375 [Candidatus Rokuibacteriota bacterium]